MPRVVTLAQQCFRRNPRDRPSINKILELPIVKRRIASFLGQTLYADEFAHTILHSDAAKIRAADPALRKLVEAPVSTADTGMAERRGSGSSVASSVSRSSVSSKRLL